MKYIFIIVLSRKFCSNYYEIKTNNLTNICIMNSFKTIN